MLMKVQRKRFEVVPLSRKEVRLQKESLQKLLGAGLLESPQRSQHGIHPYLLKDILNLRMLSHS